MATIEELISVLRPQIGDTDTTDPNITDQELTVILKNASSEYSRVKNYVKIDETNTYDKETEIYPTPTDCYKVKSAILKTSKTPLYFIDNTDQIILTSLPDLEPDVIKITYTKYFEPNEVLDKDQDLLLMHAEAQCYKLMASKTAELFKFSTGEKMVDESGISEKYLDLYECTIKKFKSRVVKAYGTRANNQKEDLDYRLPYPPEGETP